LLWARGAAVGFARAACAFAFDFFYGAALVCRPLLFLGSAALLSICWLPSSLRPGAAPLARPVQPS